MFFLGDESHWLYCFTSLSKKVKSIEQLKKDINNNLVKAYKQRWKDYSPSTQNTEYLGQFVYSVKNGGKGEFFDLYLCALSFVYVSNPELILEHKELLRVVDSALWLVKRDILSLSITPSLKIELRKDMSFEEIMRFLENAEMLL